MKNLLTSLEYHCQNTPKKIALIQNDTKISYLELYSDICQLSYWLSKHLSSHKTIGILLPNSIEWVTCTYGVILSNKIIVPLDHHSHPCNIDYIIKDCKIDLIITNINFYNKLKTHPNFSNISFLLTDIGRATDPGTTCLKEILNDKSLFNTNAHHMPEESDIATLMYTTGTTGPQKGVMLTHKNMMASTRNIIQFMEINKPIIESLPMSLSHSFGFGRLRIIFSVGGTAIIENGFLRPEKILYHMKKYSANAVSSVPLGFDIFLNRFEDLFKEIASNIEFIEIGSAPMPSEDKIKLINLCPHANICMHFGLTEASRSTFINFNRDKAFLNTAGKATPNVTIKIVNENEQELGLNQTGEIIIKGDHISQGYWNKPLLTKNKIINGWLKSGDLGFIDNKGYIHFLGRQDDIINVGGLKVSPDEIENTLRQFDGIKDAVVIGVQSDQCNTQGDTIKAFIVFEDGAMMDTAQLQKHCLEYIEAYKVPQLFESISHIPKTSSGKIRRNDLKKNIQVNGG